MSVLIKGMEMPKHDDEYVIFTVYGDGGVVYGPLNRPHVRYKNRAVHVPPHGDLIERDALTISTAVPLDGKPYQYVHIDNIKSAPTIIPAEEGET